MSAGAAPPPVTARRVREMPMGAAPVDFAGLIEEGEPVVIRGLAAHWPLVASGRQGPQAAVDYLLPFYQGRPAAGYTAAPEHGGRYGYDDSLTRLNFAAEKVRLDDYLHRILGELDQPDAPSRYVGSTDLELYFPGLAAENPLPGADFPRMLRSIWIGNRTVAAAHHDMAHNIACVTAGTRRFTLFPPEQVANLYPGPLEPTPGGQVISLVDFRAPDHDRFPGFADAVREAQVAELEPGDAVIYPALWWHHVEALSAFNMMVNVWWNPAPAFMDIPMNTLLHGMLSLRDRPAAEKAAWRALFDYYVFGPADRPVAHLPEAAQGALATLDEQSARRLRAKILQGINR